MKKGVTLIELLITMTVFSVLLISFSAIFSNGIKAFRNEMAQTQLQSEAQTLVDRIVLDVKKSRTTLKTFDTFTESPQIMILEAPAIDSNGKVLYLAGNQLTDKIVYYKEGNTLKRKVYSQTNSIRYKENGKTKTLSTNITNLNFKYDYLMNNITNLKTEIEITLEKSAGKIIRKVTARGTGSFRNIQ